MRLAVLATVLMNILRLVAAEKEKKSRPNPAFQKLEDQASCKDKGECPVKCDKDDLKKRLTPQQYFVTQQKGTERAFSGKYLRQKAEGVYTCIVCDNQLFRSDQKYETMCGWPAFSDVVAQGKVALTKDTSHGMSRIEASCGQCNAHLGHVFDDGPKPSNVRYCVNSASLDFKKHTTV